VSRADAGADLLFQAEIREAVQTAYRDLPAGAGAVLAERLYPTAALHALPAAAVTWALGVGDPVTAADLAPGEVVLDLGCGGGIDTVLAAHQVGPEGRVIAIDLLPEMCARTRAATEAAGVADRCEVEVGEMEGLPLPDGAVDVVISNGVLNLSPRKSRALAEAARVLRPGGRLCLADLVVETELPPEVLGSPTAWAGCIAGAVSERVLRRKLARAGFADIEVTGHTRFTLEDVALYPLFTAEVMELLRQLLPNAVRQQLALGVIARSRRPQRPDDAPLAAPGLALSGATPLEAIAPDAVEAPGVTVRHLKGVEDAQLKVLDVEPGGSTPHHTHGHAHEGVVISGRGRLRLEGGDQPIRPGDTFSIAPRTPHAIASEAEQPLRFVCMDCLLD
jgi:arsenite methyltransferase